MNLGNTTCVHRVAVLQSARVPVVNCLQLGPRGAASRLVPRKGVNLHCSHGMKCITVLRPKLRGLDLGDLPKGRRSEEEVRYIH